MNVFRVYEMREITMLENVCPEIHYKETEDGLVLLGCYGNDGEIVLPDEINGRPFVEIAPYAFAAGGEEGDQVKIWESPQAAFLEPGQRQKLCADLVTSIRLPEGITQVGKYAFYRCRNLTKLSLSDGVLDISGGAFNGCRSMRDVDITFTKGKKSALPSIVSEVRFALHARLHYEDGTADLLFPEHYQEAEENTPARILYWVDYGSGGYYRQCFMDREVDYKKYDELLYRAVNEEEPQTVFRLALGRLRYPYQLTETARQDYLDYLRDNMIAVVEFLTGQEDADGIRFLSDKHMLTEEALEAGIDLAAVEGKTAMLSFLMNEKNRCGKRKEDRKFLL